MTNEFSKFVSLFLPARLVRFFGQGPENLEGVRAETD